MNAQTIVVLLIVLAAAFYVGWQIKRKIKAFKPKEASCGANCGCESGGGSEI